MGLVHWVLNADSCRPTEVVSTMSTDMRGRSLRTGVPIGAMIVLCVSSVGPAVAFELITKQEAARPNQPFKPGQHRAGPVPEPEIVVRGDLVKTSPFDLVIELRPGAARARINLDSLQITYLKSPSVELRPRIQRFVDSSNRTVVIRIVGAEAPAGVHQILIQIEDTNLQQASKLVKLDIRHRS